MISTLAQIWMPTQQDLFWFSPELALVGTLVALLIAPLIMGRSARLTGTIVLVGLVTAGWLTLRVAAAVSAQGQSGLSPQAHSGMLIADNLSVFFKLVVILFAMGVTALWWLGARLTERDATEFFVLLLGSALGMILMVSTLNLLMIVIAIEMASLPSYAIVGFNKRDRLGAEVSLKYAIFGAICAALMLYGASLLFGMYHTLAAPRIATGVVNDLLAGHNTATIYLALLCFFCGIGFKISAVPFHFWCPDAFQGARIEVTTWLSVASKSAGLLLLARLVQTFAAAAGRPEAMGVLAPLAWALGIIAMLTCTVGNFGAYAQTSVKRLLAYSSIAHAGYMLMAVAIFAAPGSPGAQHGLSALLVYVVIYVFMNLGAFGITALVFWQTGSDSLDAFNGLIRRAPWLAVPMLFCLMSLVGLPPFAGFIGKYWILYALAQQGDAAHWLYWILFVVAVLNTLVSLYYYLRIVVRMMFVDDGQPEVRAPLGGIVLVNTCGLALIVILIFAGPVKHWADRYSGNLFAPPVALTVGGSADEPQT
ncbi:MAG: NADH-quinone oxidoreductase subunit N [Planctomycetes bacterium]|nr:NADH-quinone oxidoreductase subunit N [Planctomycetota bacterium]